MSLTDDINSYSRSIYQNRSARYVSSAEQDVHDIVLQRTANEPIHEDRLRSGVDMPTIDTAVIQPTSHIAAFHLMSRMYSNYAREVESGPIKGTFFIEAPSGSGKTDFIRRHPGIARDMDEIPAIKAIFRERRDALGPGVKFWHDPEMNNMVNDRIVAALWAEDYGIVLGNIHLERLPKGEDRICYVILDREILVENAAQKDPLSGQDVEAAPVRAGWDGVNKYARRTRGKIFFQKENEISDATFGRACVYASMRLRDSLGMQYYYVRYGLSSVKAHDVKTGLAASSSHLWSNMYSIDNSALINAQNNLITSFSWLGRAVRERLMQWCNNHGQRYVGFGDEVESVDSALKQGCSSVHYGDKQVAPMTAFDFEPSDVWVADRPSDGQRKLQTSLVPLMKRYPDKEILYIGGSPGLNLISEQRRVTIVDPRKPSPRLRSLKKWIKGYYDPKDYDFRDLIVINDTSLDRDEMSDEEWLSELHTRYERGREMEDKCLRDGAFLFVDKFMIPSDMDMVRVAKHAELQLQAWNASGSHEIRYVVGTFGEFEYMSGKDIRSRVQGYNVAREADPEIEKQQARRLLEQAIIPTDFLHVTPDRADLNVSIWAFTNVRNGFLPYDKQLQDWVTEGQVIFNFPNVNIVSRWDPGYLGIYWWMDIPIRVNTRRSFITIQRKGACWVRSKEPYRVTVMRRGLLRLPFARLMMDGTIIHDNSSMDWLFDEDGPVTLEIPSGRRLVGPFMMQIKGDEVFYDYCYDPNALSRVLPGRTADMNTFMTALTFTDNFEIIAGVTQDYDGSHPISALWNFYIPPGTIALSKRQTWISSQTHKNRILSVMFRRWKSLDDAALTIARRAAFRVCTTKDWAPGDVMYGVSDAVPVIDHRITGTLMFEGRRRIVAVSGHLINMLMYAGFGHVDLNAYMDTIEMNMLDSQRMSSHTRTLLRSGAMAETNWLVGSRLWHSFFDYYIAVVAYLVLAASSGWKIHAVGVHIVLKRLLDILEKSRRKGGRSFLNDGWQATEWLKSR
jgi:hypothetical protein